MNQIPAIKPTQIDLNRAEGWLEIAWNDGAVCRYPLTGLREACPCVECRGGHEFMGSEHDPDNILTLELKPMRSYKLEAIGRVGNYAVQLAWDDGHDTGIYSWGYLRNLCPPEPENS
jgi:DUF971 family protein